MSVIAVPPSPTSGLERPRSALELELELAEAHRLLRRLLEAEDRIGLVFPIMDDARRLLARSARR